MKDFEPDDLIGLVFLTFLFIIIIIETIKA